MYTDSLEKEKQLLGQICLKYNWDMKDGETACVCECPKCRAGSIIVHCIKNQNGGIYLSSYCENCGEVYYPNRIRADIFLNRKRIKTDILSTPFGDIHVELNGKRIPFLYRATEYVFPEDEEDIKEAAGKAYDVSIIDIDFSDLKPGDIIYCGFENKMLKGFASDEDYVLYMHETEDNIFGFCAGEPRLSQDVYYCYEVYNFNRKGIFYRVNKDPSQFDVRQHHYAKYVSIRTACINKSEFKNPCWAIERILE